MVAIKTSFGKTDDEISRARLEEIIKNITSRTIRRSVDYDPENTWLENIQDEHIRSKGGWYGATSQAGPLSVGEIAIAAAPRLIIALA